MKNIFLTLAFVFATTFSFAGNPFHSHPAKVVCVTVTTSCGIVGSACGSTVSGIIEAAIDLDNWVCG